MGEPIVIYQLFNCRRFLKIIEVGSLYIFKYRQNSGLLVLPIQYNTRNVLQIYKLSRPKTSFSRYKLISAAFGLTHGKRLNNPILLNTYGQLRKSVIVKILSWLCRIGFYKGNGNVKHIAHHTFGLLLKYRHNFVPFFGIVIKSSVIC